VLRFTDFDVLGHVNNAAYWAPVEECLAVRRHLRAPLRAELEFRTALEVGASVALRTVDGEDGTLALWVTDGQDVSASAVVRRWP
jgi:acyl-ACP thioesterase